MPKQDKTVTYMVHTSPVTFGQQTTLGAVGQALLNATRKPQSKAGRV